MSANLIIPQSSQESSNGQLKSQLRTLLIKHDGRTRAITARVIASLLNHNERGVRLIIRELISDGMPIASATEPPPGYFLITTWAEAKTYSESIKSRLIEDAIRRRDFNRSASLLLKSAKQARLL